jgi:GAG-pre-integrase domain
MQALKNRRKLRNKEIQLRVGNSAQVAAVTVGSIELCLPSGLIMELENIYFVPSISRNIILISCLEMNGFSFVIKDNGCSIYKDKLFYGSSFMMNGLYMMEIDKPVFNINKRLKISHESMTFMWHCRLGHINKKHIKKLYEVGLLGNFNIETINTCESCLRGKMTKVSFSKKGERTSDLLALIHTDVCGPMSTCTRNGERYFITFTDDYSRYVCDPFSRAPHRRWWRWDAEEGHGDPSMNVHLFSAGRFYRSDPLGCTSRGFLVIVSPCRFRWAQAPTVNYPGLLTSRHLWIFKRGSK